MTTTTEKKPFTPKKPASPFNVDPYNNRGGKSGNRGVADSGGKIKPMKIVTKKISGGSGGDR